MAMFAVKKLSASLSGIRSKHNVDYYCIYFLYSLRIENKLKPFENVCNIMATV